MNDIYDHAPECDVAIWLERAIETDAPRWLGVPDDVACQCQKLRACEQRVREDMALQYLVSDREQQEQEERAFAAGVQAARDAVAAVSVGGQHFWAVGFRDGTDQALAAIEALRTTNP